ncbi:hypothetical protein LELG_05313 [Lodderomyces elongisporus NRRL YB-4239]|uniref:HDA1 complex subunit 3 n=1 Tax=Lodderomyces elongisporus (strain ATCC 11503 / CBS 2605 / JCM 1781 / NBRC 1676 / NRRL YB-4239) TaxID=379508 RepID=A5E6S4_LODEL|nr:hypothetical protein LELG_05313 [Lodderomyces elongisporus NRRL YB-4239]
MNLLKILDSTPEPPIIELDLSELNYSGDYYLGTPMYEYQKELTDQIISLHYPDILKFCETNDDKDIVVESVKTCIENCMLVNSHPYLLISHYMPKNLAIKDMPAKIAETSGKFNVLKDLLNTVIASQSTTTKNVGLVLSNNVKLFDLLESLLMLCTGNKSVKRYVGNNIQRESKKASKNGNNGNGNTTSSGAKKNKGPLTQIHLIPADGELQKDSELLESTKFDVLIVVDGHVDTATEFYEKLKIQNQTDQDKPTVTIRLVPLKTVEQITLFYQDEKKNNKPDYLYKIISSVVCLRDHIGNIPPDVFPIYNQKLKYLAPNFFDHLFNENIADYPAWPLPPLPKIQKYTPIDVERSLLTEAHFHYTPYGMNVQFDEPTIPTYYELKRLQLDYVSNPLKNDYNELIGIQLSGHTELFNNNILTHKVLLQLNSAYQLLARAQRELESYERFDSPEMQNRIGRREREMKIAVSNVFDDIGHAQMRIESGNKWVAKKQEQIEQQRLEIKEKETALKKYIEEVEGDEKKEFVKNQLQIWELQSQIKSMIVKMQSKNDEKNYTLREVENSLKSIEDSKEEQEQLKLEIEELNRKEEEMLQDEEKKHTDFKKRKQELVDSINDFERSNDAMEKKLQSAFKFLRDTSHLKKRKVRTATPNK